VLVTGEIDRLRRENEALRQEVIELKKYRDDVIRQFKVVETMRLAAEAENDLLRKGFSG